MAPSSTHDGHRERLRQRYAANKLDDFAPHEVLELLLTYAIPRVDVNPISHALIRRFGSLSSVLEASPEELQQVEGVGARAAALISMMVPLFQQYERSKLTPKCRLDRYDQVMDYCRTLFMGAMDEEFYVITLDAKLNVIAAEKVSRGTPTQVAIAPRVVVREALRRNAVGVVIAHNHPSGAAYPSQEDLDVTRDIQAALDSVEIRLYDHVIIAQNERYSFQRHGVLLEEDTALAPDEPAQALAADRPQRRLPPRKR